MLTRFTNLNIISNHIIIRNIIFYFFTGNPYGGAVYIDNNECFVLIEDSFFSECSVSSHGGAIYCMNLLNFSLIRSCGYKCISNYMGQFSWVSIQNSHSNLNYFNFSSTQLCAYDLSFPYYTIINNYGISFTTNQNCSKNFVGNHLGGIGSLGCITIKIIFSTFYQIQSSMILGFSGFSTIQEFEHSNVIGTNNFGGSFGIIHVNSNGITFKLKNWIFLNNNGYINDGYNGVIQYENCFMDSMTSIRGIPILINCTTFGITSTYSLIHLNSYLCHGNINLNSKSKSFFNLLPLFFVYNSFILYFFYN